MVGFQADVEAVALFLTDDHTFQVIEDSDWKNINKSVLISTDRDLTSRLRKTLSTSLISVLHSVLFLWPSSGDVPEFQTYFRNIIQENSVSPHPLVQELWHSMMKSSGQEFVHKGFVFPKEMKAFALPSTGKVSSGYPVFNTIKAVWTLALGLKTAQQRQCRPGSDCFLTQTNALGPAVLQALQNNQNVLLETPVTFKEGKQLMFNDVFPNNGQVILTSVSGDGVFREVGRYSDKTGLITHKMTVLQHRKATTPNYYSQQIPPASLRSSALTMNPKHELSSLPTTSKKQLSSVLVTNIQNTSFGAWINRTWCLVTIAFSGAGVLVTLYVLVFLLMKFCDKTVKKNTIVISMFQLLALITMYVGALLFTFQPSFAMCGARKVVHNVAYAFNYGCLLLRAMSLRSQKTLGLGGSISQVNQMLTLLFVVGAQVALEVQWWILRPPGVVFEPGELLECSISRGDFLVCQSYIIFLLVVAVLMAFFSRNTPYCYREGYCVTVTSLLCLTVFFVWVVAFGLLPKDEDRGFSASVAQISTATVILGGIFGPQLYSLHKYGKNIHKPLSYADSLSTVFTMFKDIDSVSGGSTSSLRGKKSAKTLESPYSGEVIQNPLYDELNSAYP
ncbi:uncharacterized protein LOC106471853 [Limulus polyphemus]|uniref:Uncharacterized protein LOC106471853 n=1 Tax=Limulus polyphemus TaxID=6850 RepID=A0ABM1BSQ7_LIMPO|nr:uncharacterized protein LOC106471853 [Limulus polyphemus]